MLNSLRVRFTVAFIAIFLAVQICVGLMTYSLYGAVLRQQFDGDLIQRAQAAEARVNTLGDNGELTREQMEMFVDRVGAEISFGTARLTIIDSNSSIVATTGRDKNSVKLTYKFEDHSYDDRPFDTVRRDELRADGSAIPVRALRRRHYQSDGEYLFILSIPQAPLANDIAHFRNLLIIFGFVGALSAATGAFVVTGPIVKRINRVAMLAQQLSPDDLSRRVSIAPVNDEVANLARSVNAMLDRLQSAHVRLERFIHDASHELKTPLTTLLAETQMLQPGDVAGHEQFTLLAKEEMWHLSRLIEALLLLTRAREGETQQPQLGLLTPMSKLVANVESRMQLHREAYRVELQTRVPPLLSVGGDRVMLETMLSCVLRQSISFSPPNKNVEVVVDVGQTDEQCQGIEPIDPDVQPRGSSPKCVTIHIYDHGRRLSPEKLSGIDDHPDRHSIADLRRGVGVGLSVAAAIARRHGGSVEANTSPDGRALLDIVLPGSLFVIVSGDLAQNRDIQNENKTLPKP